jgi:hypothetical protein
MAALTLKWLRKIWMPTPLAMPVGENIAFKLYADRSLNALPASFRDRTHI